MDLGKIIHEKALEYRYDNYGVILLDAFDDYKERLKERIAKFPEAAAVLETPLASLRLKENYPWAKSTIVCTEYYGKYNQAETMFRNMQSLPKILSDPFIIGTIHHESHPMPVFFDNLWRQKYS